MSSEYLHRSFIPEDTGPKEQDVIHHCGIVGFQFQEPARDLNAVVEPLSLLQHRGQGGSRIVTMTANGTIDSWETRDKLANVNQTMPEYREFEERFAIQGGALVIGHNRYETSGSDDAAQPIISSDLILAHNGNLINPRTLIPDSLGDTVPSDTYALHWAIQNADGESLDEKLRNTLPKVKGAYSLIMADPEENVLYGVTDPWNYRPLHLGRLKDGKGYVFASETVAIKDIVDDSYELGPGEGWKIVNGEPEKFFHDPRTVEGNPNKVERQSCIFELIYFARPESKIFGANVGEFRRMCGQELAQRDFADGFIPDVIVPVRNSGTVGTEGYSAKMIEMLTKNLIKKVQKGEEISQQDMEKIPQLIPVSGLQTNVHGRVFIESEDRQEKARRKFSVDPNVVKGKSVVLVDDSVVRGDTTSAIVGKLRAAGAKGIHVRSVSPKIISECFYGIDFPDRTQLIAAGRSEEEIAELIGADSVRFLSVDAMTDIARSLTGHEGFCTSCFTDRYPNPVNPQELIMRR